ncbi:hypothetical protein ACT453_49885, partial [Bacillus sp. D-CC]
MMHYSKEDWRNYTLNVIESNERESMEEHLYECDHCLALYMESIDEQQENLPMFFNPFSCPIQFHFDCFH